MKQDARPQRQPKAKKFMVIIRPGFKTICADDACRAGMFNHILYNIAKQKQAGSDYWFSTGDAIWEETDRAWGKSKTLKEIKDLESVGIIARMRNPHNSWDQTRYFAFGEEQAKKLHELCVKSKICLASMRLPSAVTHLLNLTNAFRKNKKCICCNQQIDLLDLANPFVEIEIFPGDEAASQAGSEAPYKDSYQDSTEDSFLGARESDPVAEDQQSTEEKNSYSQNTTTTNENETQSQFEVPSFYAGLPVSWLQETTIAEQSPSQVSVPTPQIAPPIVDPATSLFPTEEKPAKQHTFGNLREGLGTPDVRQITPAQQKKLDEAEKRHKEAAEKKRKEDIWILYGKLTGSKAIRDLWSEKAVKALAEGEATDEQITQTYTWLEAKKMSTTLSYIASNLNSCVASTKPAEKPKSELKDFTHMTDEEFEAWRRRA